MSGFFRYPGGKAKLRKQIIQRLLDLAGGRDLEYREPFMGGGSIGIEFLTRHTPTTRAWLNDKDVGIACIWTSIARWPQTLKDWVESYTPRVQDYFHFKPELLNLSAMPDLSEDTDVLEIAFKKLVLHQITYSGLGTKSGGPLGGVEQKSQYKINCRWSPKHICKKIDALHKLLGGTDRVSLRANACTNLDFSEVIGDEGHEALIYLDPPYYVKGNDLYQHGFEVSDHERLAEALKATKHTWLLSYDDCEEIRKLYSWAELDSLDVNYSITAEKEKETGKRLSRTKRELLIYRK